MKQGWARRKIAFFAGISVFFGPETHGKISEYTLKLQGFSVFLPESVYQCVYQKSDAKRPRVS
jgi:hypothetical protein